MGCCVEMREEEFQQLFMRIIQFAAERGWTVDDVKKATHAANSELITDVVIPFAVEHDLSIHAFNAALKRIREMDFNREAVLGLQDAGEA